MLDSAIGPNVIKALKQGMSDFLDKNAERGWKTLDDFRGLRRERVVAHSQIKRPEQLEYHGGYAEDHEGYAAVSS
jgi:dihydropyrimidine dehydrogenase (NAD+) subunit PreA